MDKVQILFVYIDEKWFYAIVVRKNNRCVPHLGIVPMQCDVHHKSHVDKVMEICSTGFAPHDNDMRKGGTAHKSHKISFTRVGHMVKAKKDSYKCQMDKG